MNCTSVMNMYRKCTVSTKSRSTAPGSWWRRSRHLRSPEWSAPDSCSSRGRPHPPSALEKRGSRSPRGTGAPTPQTSSSSALRSESFASALQESEAERDQLFRIAQLVYWGALTTLLYMNMHKIYVYCTMYSKVPSTILLLALAHRAVNYKRIMAFICRGFILHSYEVFIDSFF